ncbi:MAG: hypothetical protein H0X34_11120 [Chthoniobacterales bacterium]|nr:hypothetical protein [Chthoniobacterales bacterium]
MSSIGWLTILSGVASSFIFVPLATSSMVTLAQDQIGKASGLFNLLRNSGGSIGIAELLPAVATSAQAACPEGSGFMASFFGRTR